MGSRNVIDCTPPALARDRLMSGCWGEDEKQNVSDLRASIGSVNVIDGLEVLLMRLRLRSRRTRSLSGPTDDAIFAKCGVLGFENVPNR